MDPAAIARAEIAAAAASMNGAAEWDAAFGGRGASAGGLGESGGPASVFDADLMADLARLREQQVSLFARHMHLETSFKNLEPVHEFDRPAFCDHFPAAFVEKDSEVQKITSQMAEIQGLLYVPAPFSMAARLDASFGFGCRHAMHMPTLTHVSATIVFKHGIRDRLQYVRHKQTTPKAACDQFI